MCPMITRVTDVIATDIRFGFFLCVSHDHTRHRYDRHRYTYQTLLLCGCLSLGTLSIVYLNSCSPSYVGTFPRSLQCTLVIGKLHNMIGRRGTLSAYQHMRKSLHIHATCIHVILPPGRSNISNAHFGFFGTQK